MIEHAAIFAADLERLKDFYVEAFGLRILVDNSRAPTAGYFLGDGRGTALEIIQRPPEASAVNQRHVCHVAFLVDDVAKTRADLERRGVRFEPDTVVDTDAMKTAFFLDPEGNRIQIVWRARPLGS